MSFTLLLFLPFRSPSSLSDPGWEAVGQCSSIIIKHNRHFPVWGEAHSRALWSLSCSLIATHITILVNTDLNREESLVSLWDGPGIWKLPGRRWRTVLLEKWVLFTDCHLTHLPQPTLPLLLSKSYLPKPQRRHICAVFCVAHCVLPVLHCTCASLRAALQMCTWYVTMVSPQTTSNISQFLSFLCHPWNIISFAQLLSFLLETFPKYA